MTEIDKLLKYRKAVILHRKLLNIGTPAFYDSDERLINVLSHSNINKKYTVNRYKPFIEIDLIKLIKELG